MKRDRTKVGGPVVPSWANYRGRCRDGYYYFYAVKPVARSVGWVSGGIRSRDTSVTEPYRHSNWQNTLVPIKRGQ